MMMVSVRDGRHSGFDQSYGADNDSDAVSASSSAHPLCVVSVDAYVDSVRAYCNHNASCGQSENAAVVWYKCDMLNQRGALLRGWQGVAGTKSTKFRC